MKRKGSVNEFSEERNKDLLRAYYELLKTTEKVVVPIFYKRLVEMPSRRFWVSEDRTSIVIKRIHKGDDLSNMNIKRRQMFQEIYRRVIDMRSKNHAISFRKAIIEVIKQPAPEFYLMPDCANRILAAYKKKKYQEIINRMKWLKQK